MTRVYLLGAGFSRAISNEMPTMDKLSAAVQHKLVGFDIPGANNPVASNFEQWLSYLIERPPWLSPADQERNRAAFFDVARAVHDVLSEHQNRAVVSGDAPAWLHPLMVYWRATSATVITFNYDLFVELAWLRSFGNEPYIRSIYLSPVPITPIGARIGYHLGGTAERNGLRLLKLHGSLSWRYSGPGSAAGDIVYDLGVLGSGWDVEGIGPIPFGTGRPDAYELSVDREPMIVPPAAVKSPYYNNRTLQALWRLAADALRQAEELVIMGFSLPQTDLLVSSMLATTLRDDTVITPVDYDTKILDRVADTFNLKGFEGARLNSSFAGLRDKALSAWVESIA